MMAALRTRYLALTRRERVLVGFAAALSALVVLVHALILPLGRAFDSAHQRHTDTTMRTARLMVAMEELRVAKAAMPAAMPADRVAAATAAQAGLEIRSNQPRGERLTQVETAAVSARIVLQWLNALDKAGLAADTLTITPSPDGTVAASVTLRRPQS